MVSFPNAMSNYVEFQASDASAIGYRLSAIGYRLSAIGYRLSAIGYRLSAIGYRPSAIHRSRLTADSNSTLPSSRRGRAKQLRSPISRAVSGKL
jgi:hypothetical protein